MLFGCQSYVLVQDLLLKLTIELTILLLNSTNFQVIGSTADNKEVVRWLHKFPRPLNPRVYIFSRTYRHDQRDVYSVESRGLAEAEFASLKTDKSYVRVETYSSTLRVRPHKKFEENG